MPRNAGVAPSLATGPPDVRDPTKGANLSSIRDEAVSLAERGWSVFPCRSGDKRPAVDQWEERACADPERVARYWPSDRHNIGVACGPSGLVVIDLDTAAHGGELPAEWQLPGVNEGADVFVTLAERAGAPLWPSTYTCRTPTGGMHLYFRAIGGREIRNSASRIGPMIDVRAAGGYVVGAGSVVPTGRYEVIDDSELIPLPGWLADLADPPRLVRPIGAQGQRPAHAAGAERPRSRFVGLLDTVLNAPPGQRNNVLHWSACRVADMVREGQVDRQAAYAALAQAAESIGLGDREVQATISSAFGRAA